MPRARRTDPATSHMAARSVTDLSVAQAAVLQVLRKMGRVTDEMLVTYYNQMLGSGEMKLPQQSDSGLRTRRKELTEMGLVRDSHRKNYLRSGRLAIIWEPVGREGRSTVDEVQERERERRAEGTLFQPDDGAPARRWDG